MEERKNSFSMGQLIWYTTAHLGLLIKPDNGEDVWRAGLFLKYINESKEKCIIIDAIGQELLCPTYMIQSM
jgi:hypothetical protein